MKNQEQALAELQLTEEDDERPQLIDPLSKVRDLTSYIQQKTQTSISTISNVSKKLIVPQRKKLSDKDLFLDEEELNDIVDRACARSRLRKTAREAEEQQKSKKLKEDQFI